MALPAPGTASAGVLQAVVVNVNGLRCSQKRHHLFNRLNHSRYDLILLVETHSRDDAETRKWAQEGAGPGMPWLGQSFWHHGSSQSRGVAVLVRAGCVPGASAFQVDYRDDDGRVLRLGWSSGGHNWAVVVVYAPVEPAQRPAFFAADGPMAAAMQHGRSDAFCLTAGDFNNALDSLDYTTSAASESSACRTAGAAALQQLQTSHGLIDVWRDAHPTTREYTKIASNGHGTTAGRTSRWLISDVLPAASWLAAVVHKYADLPGDHAAVALTLSPPNVPLRGAGTWSFPLYLLSLPDYVDQVPKWISDAQASTPCAHSAADTWEWIKISIKRRTLAFCYALRRRLQSRRRSLHSTLTAATLSANAHPSAATLQSLATAAAALASHDEAVADQLADQARLLWDDYGKQSTAWFHRLAGSINDNAPLQSIRATVTAAPADLSTATGVRQAGAILADFFDGNLPTGLFAPAVVDASAQRHLLQCVDKTLPSDLARACDGEDSQDGSIQPSEARHALSTLPAGKRPGSDGLPYEFYRQFWSAVEAPLLAAFNEPFTSAATAPSLSPSQRLGLLTLIFKKGGKPRDDVDSYRPITLLNSDYKIVSKAIANRLALALGHVIDDTQTAFVPGRWIGDNVLFHLEEVDYLQHTQQPGCITFLDFSKAYDRVDRGWLMQCMQKMGFSSACQRWVQLLLQGTQGRVMYNGHFSRAFAVHSSIAQGSPLSPLLWVIAAQPLAACLRQLQASGTIDAVSMPDGSRGPPSFQHADDTTIHTASVRSAQQAIQLAVTPFCSASGSRLNLDKTQGLLLGALASTAPGASAAGLNFAAPGQSIRHLGVPLTTGDAPAAAAALYDQRKQTLQFRIRHWSRFDLTLLGRVHVAKQLMASTLVYHATFFQPSASQLQELSTILDIYITKGMESDVGSVGLGGRRPSKHIMALPKLLGGLAATDLPAQVSALQAKVAAALLHPRRTPWKQLMRAALDRELPDQGVYALVHWHRGSTSANTLSPRRKGYIDGLHSVGVHRILPHAQMSTEQISSEPLLHSRSVCPQAGTPFSTSRRLPPAIAACRTIGDAAAVMSAVPSTAAAIQQVLHPAWWLKLSAPSGQPSWQVSPDEGWVRHTTTQLSPCYYRVRADGQLVRPLSQDTPPGTVHWVPACVVSCPDIKAGPPAMAAASAAAAPPAPSAEPAPTTKYLAGPWTTVQVDPSLWGLTADQPLTHYTVKTGTMRCAISHATVASRFCHGLGARPKLWRDGRTQDGVSEVAAIAQRQQSRFLEALRYKRNRRSVPGDANLTSVYHAPWFDPSPPRQHVQQRTASRQLSASQTASSQSSLSLTNQGRLLSDDSDPYPCVGTSPQVPWQAVWKRLHARMVPRRLTAFGWLLLHGDLPVGATLVPTLPHSDPAALIKAVCCSAQCCSQPSSVTAPQHLGARSRDGTSTDTARPLETVQHLYLGCPASAPALQWLSGLWSLLDPTKPAPPITPSVMLADDQSTWSPSSHLQHLWTTLRLALLYQVWVVRCARTSTSAHACHSLPTAVVSSFVSVIRAAVMADWRRVEGVDPTVMVQLPGASRAHRPAARSWTTTDFTNYWGHGGVIAAVDAARTMRFNLKVTTVTGVAL